MTRRLTNPRWNGLILLALTLAFLLPGLSSLPVLDRDEARYAQASVQMADSNDLLNIRYQDEARNKKPAGAYWAQTAMIKLFSRDGERRIWVQRLPSVLASLLSVLALYWGGSRLVGRDAAFIAAALLAVSTIFVFEGHIAKTDALLCATTTFVFASLGRLRRGGHKWEVWVFWIALGLSIMIKGPIAPVLVILSLLSLWIWEKNLSWTRPLLSLGPIAIFILIWVPWGIAIYAATDGVFFTESIGEDFGRKVTEGDEGHGAPPGFHSAMIWMTLWPASLFLLPAFVIALQKIKGGTETRLTQAIRFLICWSVPFWVLIELMPTKLPHYGLPVFPAICLLIGASLHVMRAKISYKKSRLIGGCVFILSTGLLLGALIYVQNHYGDGSNKTATYLISGLAGLSAIIAIAALWRQKINLALGAGVLSSWIFLTGSYGYLLPNISNFNTSERVLAELQTFAPNADSGDIHSPHYAEPSLVYHIGKNMDLKNREIDLSDGSLVILNMRRQTFTEIGEGLTRDARSRGRCLRRSNPVTGFNYSRGAPLNLIILQEAPC